MIKTIRIATVGVAVTVVGALFAACGSSGGGAAAVDVSDAWVRASIPGKDMTAAYMELRNTGGSADELLAVSLPADVAERAEIHETVAVEDGSTDTTMGHDDHSTETTMGHDDHSTDTTMGHDDHATGTTGGSIAPVMEMRKVSKIDLPEEKTVRLEPGGYHVMVFGVKKPLKAGQKVRIELRFRHAGTTTVTAEVRTG